LEYTVEKSVVGIEIWFSNLLLSLNFKFKRFWNFYLKWISKKIRNRNERQIKKRKTLKILI
jgi:hypothetical protein